MRLLLLAYAALLTASAAHADGNGVPLAIEGYDPVAYFTRGHAASGDPSQTHTWMGKEWRFASAEHRNMFAAKPDRYAPAYNGACAWAVSRGYLQPASPLAFAIVRNRLFLNWSPGVRARWLVNAKSNIASGDYRWRRLEGLTSN